MTQVSSGATTTYSYDVANELLTAEDASGRTTFTYDANGNTTGEIRPNADRVTYTWDIEDHLTRVELPSDVVNTVTLDGDGKRRSIEDSDGLRNVIWDAENILAETDSGDATVARYTLAPQTYGELISQRRAGATSFHHYDALGSTNKLTGADETTLVEYLYRAFGQQTVISGSSANRFTWVARLGYYRQPDPDDYWVRARIPQPRTGRWLTRDSEEQLTSLYGYAANNPTMRVDPSGLQFTLSVNALDVIMVTVQMPYSSSRVAPGLAAGVMAYVSSEAGLWSFKYGLRGAPAVHGKCNMPVAVLISSHVVPEQPLVAVIMPGPGRWSQYRFYVAGHVGRRFYPFPPRHIGAHEIGHWLYLGDEYDEATGENLPFIEPRSVMGGGALEDGARTYARHYTTIAARFNTQYRVSWEPYEL